MIPFHRSFYCSIFGLKNTESKCRRIFFRLLLLLRKQNEYLSNEWTSLGALRQFRNDKMKNKVENFLQKKEILTQKKSWKSFWQREASAFSFLFFFSSNVNRWFSQFQKQTLKFVSIFNFTNSQKKLTHKIAICVVKLSLSIYLYLYWFVSYVVGSTFISLA